MLGMVAFHAPKLDTTIEVLFDSCMARMLHRLCQMYLTVEKCHEYGLSLNSIA